MYQIQINYIVTMASNHESLHYNKPMLEVLSVSSCSSKTSASRDFSLLPNFHELWHRIMVPVSSLKLSSNGVC